MSNYHKCLELAGQMIAALEGEEEDDPAMILTALHNAAADKTNELYRLATDSSDRGRSFESNIYKNRAKKWEKISEAIAHLAVTL